MLAGAVTDFAAFDPHEERLSNMLKNIGEGDTVFNNAITEYLAMDETDSAIEGRLKQAIEGLGIGAVSDGLFAAAKWLRIRYKHRAWRKTEVESTDTGEITEEDLLDLDEAIKTNEVTKDLSAADQKKVAEKVRKNVDEATGEPKSEIDEAQPAQSATPEDVAKADMEPELHHIHRSVKDHMKIKGKLSEADILKLSKHIQNGEMSEASQMINFNDAKIDWDSMDDADSIQQLFYAFEDVAADMLKEGADGPVTMKATKKIAEDVGYTGENAEMLFGTLKESGGITARMFAAHQAMVASARHLRKLAMKAKKTGAPQDMHNMHRHVELHAALMAQVKGSQSEIARALSAMRMMKDATAESWKEFDEVKRVMGGHKDTDAVIDSVLAGKGDLRELNKAVAKTQPVQ
jgi:ethanolamine utilization protein EutQ (cupin superfamily)